MWVVIGHLCEGEPSLVIDFEDLLDGVDVGSRPQVQTQVVPACCAHDLLKKAEKTTCYSCCTNNSLVTLEGCIL